MVPCPRTEKTQTQLTVSCSIWPDVPGRNRGRRIAVRPGSVILIKVVIHQRRLGLGQIHEVHGAEFRDALHPQHRTLSQETRDTNVWMIKTIVMQYTRCNARRVHTLVNIRTHAPRSASAQPYRHQHALIFRLHGRKGLNVDCVFGLNLKHGALTRRTAKLLGLHHLDRLRCENKNKRWKARHCTHVDQPNRANKGT